MNLKLIRDTFTSQSTLGTLYVGDYLECFTLEDAKRPKKIKHETCIPAGTYKVIVTPSARFKKRLPLLLNVPGFEGIRIHSGNTKADTSGCILVGTTKGKDFIGHSREAFNRLFPQIDRALKEGEEVTIEIVELT